MNTNDKIKLMMFNLYKYYGNFIEMYKAKVSAASRTLHRVYVGPRKTRKDAEELAAVMGNSGYKGIVTSLEQGS